jgi:hypothetical protein
VSDCASALSVDAFFSRLAGTQFAVVLGAGSPACDGYVDSQTPALAVQRCLSAEIAAALGAAQEHRPLRQIARSVGLGYTHVWSLATTEHTPSLRSLSALLADPLCGPLVARALARGVLVAGSLW